MPQQDLILVGVVHGAHGVRGQLRVESLTDNPVRFSSGRCVYACLPQQQPRTLTVSSATPHQGRLLLTVAEVNSRQDAQLLLGAQLMAEPDSAPLPPGQYYHYQLLGLAVYQEGVYVGEVVEILNRPANDVYVLRNSQQQEIWLPALKSVIKRIDLDERRMEVDLPPGLDVD